MTWSCGRHASSVCCGQAHCSGCIHRSEIAEQIRQVHVLKFNKLVNLNFEVFNANLELLCLLHIHSGLSHERRWRKGKNIRCVNACRCNRLQVWWRSWVLMSLGRGSLLRLLLISHCGHHLEKWILNVICLIKLPSLPLRRSFVFLLKSLFRYLLLRRLLDFHLMTIQTNDLASLELMLFGLLSR